MRSFFLWRTYAPLSFYCIMYLIIGANGQLGTELRNILGSRAVYADLEEVNIVNREETLEFIRVLQPQYIINCAAYTAVDKAEADEKTAYEVNALGPENLAMAAKACGATFLHVSTDYVYDGKGSSPYVETQVPDPQNAYGRTKLAGEQLALAVGGTIAVVRTAWLYSPYGGNFVKTMLRLGEERESVNVICDQIGSPTSAGDLAEMLVYMAPRIEKGSGEIYHFTNEGVASWYDFAMAVMELSGTVCKVLPIATSQYPTPAARPAYSILSKAKIKKAFGREIPYWRTALKACLLRLKEEMSL